MEVLVEAARETLGWLTATLAGIVLGLAIFAGAMWAVFHFAGWPGW